ncbi:MAG: hypothetical protein JWO32_2289, partial [Bacteroidetes bacterium]|nr:hypothetical protein [Bacteroidota bacterium]
QSGVYGSLMIRPVFGKKITPPVGLVKHDGKTSDFVNVYPNPSNEHFTLEIKDYKKSNYRLINSLGQLVLQGALTANVNSLNTSELNTGIYFLEINTDDFTQRVKIIIQH